jgi:hypothetical protein
MPTGPQLGDNDMGGRAVCLFDVSISTMKASALVRPTRSELWGSGSQGVAWIDDNRQRLVVDADEFRGILRYVRVVREYRGDGLPYVANLVLREDGMTVLLEIRKQLVVADLLERDVSEVGDICANERALDPLEFTRLCHVDRRDQRVRDRRPHDPHPQLPLDVNIVGEPAASPEEPVIFQTRGR